MRAFVLRRGLALLLSLCLVGGGLAPGLSPSFGLPPDTALAADATVTTCDEGGLNAALDAVQMSGGGTITFDCSGTITFSGQKLITSSVSIVGNGAITFDGDKQSTRFFEVDAGASLELIGLSLVNGGADRGGAIINNGTLTVTTSAFNDNASDMFGGAIYNVGLATIAASTFDDNVATFSGGAIFSAATLMMTASTFSVNRANLNGGAIHNIATANITASTFYGNHASSGGAIANEALLEVTDSTFDTNGADAGGGAIYNQTNGTASIEASTFVRNATGIAGGAIDNEGELTIRTSTFTENWAIISGGVIANDGTLELLASTLSGNWALESGGGGALHNDGSAGITASIIADNTDHNGANCSGSAPASGGWNLSDDASCNLVSATLTDFQNSTAINLDELADNGGPTLTMMPLAGSAALGTVPCPPADPPTTTVADQRGAPRPVAPADHCDRGAVESGVIVPVRIVAFVATGSTTQVTENSSLSLHAIAYGPDNSNLRYALDCAGNDDFGASAPLSGNTIDASCWYADDGVYTITIRVCDGNDLSTCETASLPAPIEVANLPPVITSITTNAPVRQGQPVTITVTAGDPGLDDHVTSYAFDCDNDGVYETPGIGNQGSCQLDPSLASATIGVQVMDNDGGVATGSVEVGQAATVCGNRATGALSAPLANGACPPGTMALSVPAPAPMAFCINPYTGALVWSPQGACGAGYRAHVVPDDGPLHYCQSIYTGKLRHTATGQCSTGERPGVIPG